MDNIDDSPELPPKSVRLVQQIAGTLLYYAIAVNVSMLVAFYSIVTTQSQGTNNTYDKTLWLINYAAMYPDATIRYSASDMILHNNSDASYLYEQKDRSRAGGHYFLRPRSPYP